jgi:hypothetical protein
LIATDRGLTPTAQTNAAALRLLSSKFQHFVPPYNLFSDCDTVSYDQTQTNRDFRRFPSIASSPFAVVGDSLNHAGTQG